MKIVIATPLYPPDIADPAPYVKELARRLSGEHAVHVVTYGKIPETLPGVTLHTTDKRSPAVVRLLRFTYALFRAARGADVIYVQTGMSAELPTLVVSLFLSAKLLFRNSAEPKQGGLVRRTIRSLTERRATRVDTGDALVRPEILPLEPYPTAALQAYESAWERHSAELTAL